MGLACMFMSCRQHGHGARPAHHGHPHSQHRQPLQLQRHKQQEGVDHTLAGTGVALECAAHTDIACCASLGWCAVCGCSLAQQEAYQQQVSCSVFPQLQLLRVITMQSCPCCRLGPDHISACLLKSCAMTASPFCVWMSSCVEAHLVAVCAVVFVLYLLLL